MLKKCKTISTSSISLNLDVLIKKSVMLYLTGSCFESWFSHLNFDNFGRMFYNLSIKK